MFLEFKNERFLHLAELTYQYGNQKQETIHFVKIPQTKKERVLGYALDDVVNKAVMAGRYDLLWPEPIHNTSFVTNGKVTGWPKFNHYSIVSTLNMEPMNNLAEIYLTGKASFTYKFDKDTLNLYNTYPNADSTELNVGDLKYKLVRKH